MKKNLLVLGAVALTAIACGKKSESPNEGALAPQGEAKVSGPSLEGNWASGCIDGLFSSSAKRRIFIKVAGDQIEHQEISYADATCNQVYKKDTLKGSFFFTKNLGNNIYTIKYFIPIDANISTWRYQNISIQNDLLNISDLDIEADRLERVQPKIELQKRAASTPPSQTNPAPIILESGVYESSDSCAHVVSTAESGGKLAAVYIDQKCGGSFTFQCDGNTCQSSAYLLKVLSSRSYQIVAKSGGQVFNFKKQ